MSPRIGRGFIHGLSWGSHGRIYDHRRWKDLFVTNGIRSQMSTQGFLLPKIIGVFSIKMEKDPNYKNIGGRGMEPILKYLKISHQKK